MVCNKKRKPVFIKWKWKHVVFSRPTILSFYPVYMYIYIYIYIYIYTHTLNYFSIIKKFIVFFVYIYIYIYMCVCVYICVWLGSSNSFKYVSLNSKDKFCLYNSFKILSSLLISVLVPGCNSVFIQLCVRIFLLCYKNFQNSFKKNNSLHKQATPDDDL